MIRTDPFATVPRALLSIAGAYFVAMQDRRFNDALHLRQQLPDGVVYDLMGYLYPSEKIGVVLHEAEKPEATSKVVLSYPDVATYEALRGYLNQVAEGEPFALGWYLIVGSKRLARGVLRSNEAALRAIVILPSPGTAAEIAVTLEHLAAQVQGYLKACEESGFLGPKRQGHLGRAIAELRVAAGCADPPAGTPSTPPTSSTRPHDTE